MSFNNILFVPEICLESKTPSILKVFGLFRTRRKRLKSALHLGLKIHKVFKIFKICSGHFYGKLTKVAGTPKDSCWDEWVRLFSTFRIDFSASTKRNVVRI